MYLQKIFEKEMHRTAADINAFELIAIGLKTRTLSLFVYLFVCFYFCGFMYIYLVGENGNPKHKPTALAVESQLNGAISERSRYKQKAGRQE